MTDDYSAGALYQLWSPMIRAAVDSDARCHGLGVVESGQLWYDADTSTWIDAQGFAWGVASDGKQQQDDLRGWNPKASALHWAEVIPALWDGWDVLPDPEHLGTPTEADLGVVYGVVSGLAMSPDARGYAVDGGDGDLLSDVTVVQTSVGGMYGEAMLAFNREVSSRLVYTLQLQAEATAVIAFAIQAEQHVWTAARTNLMQLARDAVVSFDNAFPAGQEQEDSTWLKVVGAILDVASLTPVGRAASIFSDVAKGAKALAVFQDAGASERAHTRLDAASPQGVCDRITQELQKLEDNVASAEGAIAEGCRNAATSARSGGELARPSVLDTEDPAAVVALAVELPKLRAIAATLGRIATRTRAYGNAIPTAMVSLNWERPGGFGANPFGDVEALASELQNLIATSASRLELAGDHMAELAKDFAGTDGTVANRFQQRTTAVAS